MKSNTHLLIVVAVYWLSVVYLVAGALCWLTPNLIFGTEGYRTVARGIIGTLGGFSMSIGICAMLATLRQNAFEMVVLLRIIIINIAVMPAVIFYNMGALEPLRQSSGFNIFSFVGTIFLFILLPACLAFFALKKKILGATT